MRSQQPFGMRLYPQQSRWVGEHGLRVGLGETASLDDPEEHLGVPACHVGVALAIRKGIPEVPPSVDDLLR